MLNLRYNGSVVKVRPLLLAKCIKTLLKYKDNLFIFDNEEIKLESALRPPE